MVAAGVFVFSPESPVIYSKNHSKITGYVDFFLFYSAGDIITNGSPETIYYRDTQTENLEKLLNVPVRAIIPIPYPPQSLFSFALLANFSPATAFYIWQLVNIAATLAIIGLLYFFVINNKNYKSLFLITLLVISSYPWVASITQGQVVILMTLGLLGYQLLAKNKYYGLACLSIILTAFKPPLVFTPVLYLIIINGKSLWYNAIAVGIFVIAICSALFGFSIWLEYINVLTLAYGQSSQLGYNLNLMTSIRSFLVQVFGSEYLPIINSINTILILSSIAFLAWLAFKLRNSSIKLQELGFALAIAINCLVNPWVPPYSLLPLTISVAYLIKYRSFKHSDYYITALVFFGFAGMFIDGYSPFINSFIWIPVQAFLIGLIGKLILQENKKSSTLAVVS